MFSVKNKMCKKKRGILNHEALYFLHTTDEVCIDLASVSVRGVIFY